MVVNIDKLTSSEVGRMEERVWGCEEEADIFQGEQSLLTLPKLDYDKFVARLVGEVKRGKLSVQKVAAKE